MESVSIHGWENEHELNSFPFVEPLVSDQGHDLPNGLIVDAHVVSIGNPTVVVRSVSITSSNILIEWLLDDGNRSKILKSTCSVNGSDSAVVDIADENGLSYGKVVFGRASSIAKKILSKTYTFKKKNIQLETSCITSLGNNHVTGISVLGEVLRGAVALKEGIGVSIVVGENENFEKTIQINATGSIEEECCQDDYDPLKKINTVLPDLLGNFIIGSPMMSEPINKDSERETILMKYIQNGIMLEVI